MRIAPDIDAMMWNIADTHDIAAADSFTKMFPDLKSELSKRIRLVEDLREAKSLHIVPINRPAFVAKRKVGRLMPSKPVMVAGFFFLGAVMALAAYWAGVRYSPVTPAKDSVLGVKANLDNCLPPVPTAKRTAVAPSTMSREEELNRTPEKPGELATPSFPLYGVPSAPDSVPNQSANKGLHIDLRGVSLSDAVHAIALQGKLEVEMAPNMPTSTIDVSYDDADAVSVLKDLGSKYGFGVVVEGADKVLLVPGTATQPNESSVH